MSECIANSHCATGFCDGGTCKTPGLGDTCRENKNDCSQGTCSYDINRCVLDVNATRNNPCSSNKDCHPSKYCKSGKCLQRPFKGACTFETGCDEPYECYNAECVRRCIQNGLYGCDSKESCRSVGFAFDICVKHLEPVKSTKKEEPVKEIKREEPVRGEPVKEKPAKETKIIHVHTPATSVPNNPNPVTARPPPRVEPAKNNDALVKGVAVIAVLLIIGLVVLVIYFLGKRKRTIPPPPPPMIYGSPMSPVIAAPVVAVPNYPQYPNASPHYVQQSPYQTPQRY